MNRTLKQLIECYQTDPHSNFLKLQYQVRAKHGRLLARLSREHGSHQLRNVRFRNLTVWYNAWVSDGKIAMARSMVDRLRELFRFGATLLEDRECNRLFEAVGKLRLENSPPRTVQMTAEHANAIRRTAREHFGWYSIALAQALQFELLLSQKDVIGEWVPVTEPGKSDVIWAERRLLRQKDVVGEWIPVDEPGEAGVWAERKQKWLRGLRWSNIDKNLILRHAAGSSGRTIEVDLRTAPMVLEELKIQVADLRSIGSTANRTLHDILEELNMILKADSLPSAGTAPETAAVTLHDLTDGSLPCSGPMIICDTNGLPWSTAEFRRKWRKVAKQAGVPDNVNNKDSFPAGMIRGGPDRAKISQTVTLKRIDYSLRMQSRAGRLVE
jgi:hypothetical protein